MTEVKEAANRMKRWRAGENAYKVYMPEHFEGEVFKGVWSLALEHEFRDRQNADKTLLAITCIELLDELHSPNSENPHA